MMSIPLRLFGSELVTFLKDIDILANNLVPDGAFSAFSGQPKETISSSMGKAQARIIWGWKHGEPHDPNYDYPLIPITCPLGQLSEDICEVFQPYHGLRSIEWDRGVDIQALYPGIKQIVIEYLAAKGIK